MEIRFTKHAREKFEILARHGLKISEKKVIATVRFPTIRDYSRHPLIIAQGGLDRTRVLRVVYKIYASDIVIITFYPGRKSQYEK